MCGIAGYLKQGDAGATPETLSLMLHAIQHRGPDQRVEERSDGFSLGFVRLSIVALDDGRQPIWNESHDVLMACNGEIYNHRELRAELEARGHRFLTQSDCEVILHLYEELGEGFAARLNGQFAYAIYDSRDGGLHLGRDAAGIQPMFYAKAAGAWVFGSEIKALLCYPGVGREIDLVGLDQLLTFPGAVSPRTLFRGVESVRPGHAVRLDESGRREHAYWDLEFPESGCEERKDPAREVDRFLGLFIGAVRRRQKHAEVPLCSYLSGGLDSSFIAAVAAPLARPLSLVALGVRMHNAKHDESSFQDRLVAGERIDYRGIAFGVAETLGLLRQAVRHAETPLKESYNAASLALSKTARSVGAKVILSGEGADELFGGYVGYRFDQHRKSRERRGDLREAALREKVFGSADVFYERELTVRGHEKAALYSPRLRDAMDSFDCLNHPLLDTAKIRGRDPVNQRSYLDFKLRLADHLLSDHGDRMTMANSVEGRYPFLDAEILDFARQLAPDLKVNGFVDKFVVRKAAAKVLPSEFGSREKFHFTTPTSAELLRSGDPEVRHLLSASRTRELGLFDPDWVEARAKRYSLHDRGGQLSLRGRLADDRAHESSVLGGVRDREALSGVTPTLKGEDMQYDILGAILKQIRERGSEPAVAGRQSLTYADLGSLSSGVAAALTSVLGREGGRVIVLSADAEALIPALLGVLRAGCTYVPVLPELPLTRLEFIRRKVNPVAVLHDESSRSIAETCFPGLPHFVLGALHGTAELHQPLADHPAYIFFTSGSTGEPKGIVGRYASLSQFIHWEARMLGLAGPTRVSQLVSPMFDAFLRDALLPLSLGGCCCVPDESTREDASRLAAWVGESGVEVLHTVPSFFRALFGTGSEKVSAFPALRHVLLSGEALLPSDAQLWLGRLGERVSLHNLYGATETTMIKFFHRVSREDAAAASIPVGRPMEGASAWIADADLSPVADGESGEIVVETEFRTLGYLDDPAATRRAFVPLAEEPSRIVYRTGDIGRRRFDGVFEFLGRRDRQLKIRGVRIEPTEIEEAARTLPGMLDCALDAETLDDGSAALALYAVLTQGLTADTLRAHLQDRLPGPYLPSAVRVCHEIPRLLSGKVDFVALRTAAKRSRHPSDPPTTPLEVFVLDLFRRLVRDETVGKEDNFFDVGGHSLLAIQALSRIREEQQVEVPLAAFFENATARALAAFVANCPVLSSSAEAKPAEEDRISLAALSDQDLDRLLADLTRQG